MFLDFCRPQPKPGFKDSMFFGRTQSALNLDDVTKIVVGRNGKECSKISSRLVDSPIYTFGQKSVDKGQSIKDVHSQGGICADILWSESALFVPKTSDF